jgi:hypothetical protein
VPVDAERTRRGKNVRASGCFGRKKGMTWRVVVMPVAMIVLSVIARTITCVVRIVFERG